MYKSTIPAQNRHYSHCSYALYSLILCLLLSGCQFAAGNGVTKTNTSAPTPTPRPAIDATLKDKGAMQLETFQQWIGLMKQYGGDTTTYQQQYQADQQALQNAKTVDAYNRALTTTTSHVDAIQLPAMQAQTKSLQQQLTTQVNAWGQQHTYHDTYNNQTYPLDNEYGDSGIGGWVQNDLATARTMADYQQAIENLNMYLANFQAMVADANDKTPYDQPHQTDIQLMKKYSKMDQKVIVISLYEQTMRIYDQGKLVKAFETTTGRPERPTPPGSWWVEGRETNITFHSSDPVGSPFWYADTHINYALPFHSDGYFLHDSWWRADYGFGTNFPHADTAGEDFGSHGCVNLPTNEAQWLYNFAELYTGVIIY